MKKRTLILLIISVLFAGMVSGIYRVQDVQVVTTQAWNPVDSTLYYVTNQNMLFHIDSRGNVLMREHLNKTQDGNHLRYWNVNYDAEGNIYLLVSAYQDNTLVDQWIECRKSNGTLVKQMDALDYPITEKTYFSLQRSGDSLIVFSVSTDHMKLYLDEYNLHSEQINTRIYQFDQPQSFSWIKYVQNGSVYYTDTLYDIYCLDNRTLQKYQYPISAQARGLGACLADNISQDAEGNIYFSDIYQMRLLRYNEAVDELSVVYEQTDEIGDGLIYDDVSAVRYVEDTMFGLMNAMEFDSKGFFIKTDEGITIIDKIYYDIGDCSLLFLLTMVGSFVVLYLLVNFVTKGKRTHSILKKQLLATIPLFLISMGVVGYYLQQYFFQRMKTEAFEETYILSKNIADQLDGEMLEEITLPLAEQDDFFLFLDQQLNLDTSEFYEANPEAVQKSLYYNVYITKDGQDYLVFRGDSTSFTNMRGINRSNLYANCVRQTQPKVSHDGKMSLEIITGDGAEHLYCLYAICEDDGEVVGHVEVGLEYSYFYATLRSIMTRFILMFSGITVLVILLMIWQTKRNLRGMSKLREGVLSVSQQNWNVVVDVNSNDEIQEIADAFNRMSREIGTHLKEMEKMNVAYEKFVPRQTLSLLHRNSVSDITLEKHINQTMMVLTMNISNFYQMNEVKTSAETFQFMNQMYKTMMHGVIQSGGMVERCTESGIRALYPIHEENAISCALKILEKIKMQQCEIALHVLIQLGDVMYGIAGTSEQVEAIAVSNILNYTPLLQEVAKMNHIPIVVTAPVYEYFSNMTQYHMRYIGKIKIKEEKPIFMDMYEVLDAYTAEEKKCRIQTREIFETGIEYFQKGELKEARKYFVDVIRMNEQDLLAQNYLFLCDRFIEQFPESWDGYFL